MELYLGCSVTQYLAHNRSSINNVQINKIQSHKELSYFLEILKGLTALLWICGSIVKYLSGKNKWAEG